MQSLQKEIFEHFLCFQANLWLEIIWITMILQEDRAFFILLVSCSRVMHLHCFQNACISLSLIYSFQPRTRAAETAAWRDHLTAQSENGRKGQVNLNSCFWCFYLSVTFYPNVCCCCSCSDVWRDCIMCVLGTTKHSQMQLHWHLAIKLYCVVLHDSDRELSRVVLTFKC